MTASLVRLAQCLRIQVGRENRIRVWSPRRMGYVSLDADDLRLLGALASGTPPEQALALLGVQAGAENAAYLSRYVDLGLLEADGRAELGLLWRILSGVAESLAVVAGAVVEAIGLVQASARRRRDWQSVQRQQVNIAALDSRWEKPPSWQVCASEPPLETRPVRGAFLTPTMSVDVETTIYPLT
jgi:hypothetical protein